jgi:hypothetical protein
MNLKLPAVASPAPGIGPVCPPPNLSSLSNSPTRSSGSVHRQQGFRPGDRQPEFAVATINRLRPAFVVVSGDLLNRPGDASQIREYQRIMSRVGRNIPVYPLAGNHDIGNIPSPAGIATYTNHFGPDHYTFRHGDFVGIVLNSVIIHTAQQITNQLPNRNCGSKLNPACQKGARTSLFSRITLVLKTADEPDEYFNIPGTPVQIPGWFREAGVKYSSGHYHRNAAARDVVLKPSPRAGRQTPEKGESGRLSLCEMLTFSIVFITENCPTALISTHPCPGPNYEIEADEVSATVGRTEPRAALSWSAVSPQGEDAALSTRVPMNLECFRRMVALLAMPAVLSVSTLVAIGQGNGIFADFTTSMGSLRQLDYVDAPGPPPILSDWPQASAWLLADRRARRTRSNGLTFHRVIAGFAGQSLS